MKYFSYFSHTGDSLQEMSNPVYGKNKKNIINLSSAESAHCMTSVNKALMYVCTSIDKQIHSTIQAVILKPVHGLV